MHIPSHCSWCGISGRLPCVVVALAAIACSAWSDQAMAASGDNLTIPFTKMGKPTYSSQSRLQIRVDSTWAGNRGYRPVRVTVSMAKPATADTQITIDFHAGNWRNEYRAISVETDLELPQGASSVTTTLSVPQYFDWNGYGWDTWVDGVKDEQLCMAGTGFNAVSTGAVAVGSFSTGLWNTSPTQLLISATGNAVESQDFNYQNLPSDWTDYTCLDVMSTTVGALELLRVSAPEKLEALLRWVRSGGNLWVSEVGQDFSELAIVERIVSGGSETAPIDFDFAAARLGHWRFLMLSQEGRARLKDLIRLSMEESGEESALSSIEITVSDDPQRASDSRRWFVARSLGMGTVVAFQSAPRRRRPAGEDASIALQRSSLTDNLNWAGRYGNDPASGNPNFNHLLIPDVGAAPVFEFQMLITLFVIAIGPVNYWLLKRQNQLPLLLVTVPVAALAATLMLFVYGFFADGIGTRVRVRSMTMLDQNVGELASWARLSYYAGIAPSDGLRMPDDTTVYPILPTQSRNSGFGRQYVNQQRSVEWTDEQQLTRGWLGSRTPTQYLAVTARSTKKKLQFEHLHGKLKVTNLLGTNVLALVVQDSDGNLFTCDSVDTEGSAVLEPSTYVKSAAKIRRFLTENIPQLPAGYVESRRNRSRRQNSGISMTDSLMELHFEAIVSPIAISWGDRTYVAITEAGIEVPLGLDDAMETSSFHIVRGSW